LNQGKFHHDRLLCGTALQEVSSSA
jgi:hypothetical protein